MKAAPGKVAKTDKPDPPVEKKKIEKSKPTDSKDLSGSKPKESIEDQMERSRIIQSGVVQVIDKKPEASAKSVFDPKLLANEDPPTASATGLLGASGWD